MSGLELAVKLREYDPRGFIVFITAHDDMMFETFRYRLEALDYIVKGAPAMMAARAKFYCITLPKYRQPHEYLLCRMHTPTPKRHTPISGI